MSPVLPQVVRLVKRLVPAPALDAVRRSYRRHNYVGNQYVCPACGTGLAYFAPLPEYYFLEWDRHQYRHSIFLEETLHVRQFSCPACGATDRDRLCVLYIERRLADARSARPVRVLEIGPSPAMRDFLRRQPSVAYRSADLHDPSADDRLDITDLSSYAAGAFDLVVCSHVLEHVPDDQRAMRELRRVLAPGGTGLVLVPINLGLDEIAEDAAATSDADRWHRFGQHDHVRLYSKRGFLERLARAGLAVAQWTMDDFGATSFARAGIHPRSVLYVVTASGDGA